MESRDLVSVARPFFLGLEGYRSPDFDTAKKWFSKISIIQRFLFVVFGGKKQPKQVRKMPEIWKRFKLEVMTTVFFLILAKSINFQVSSLRLEIFDEVSFSISKFYPGIGLEGYGLDYITGGQGRL